ncbi:MAG: hypothetical protein LBT13_04930 [Treponema sp.]|nr:hypothetical protein [Treponema sp.]
MELRTEQSGLCIVIFPNIESGGTIKSGNKKSVIFPVASIKRHHKTAPGIPAPVSTKGNKPVKVRERIERKIIEIIPLFISMDKAEVAAYIKKRVL